MLSFGKCPALLVLGVILIACNTTAPSHADNPLKVATRGPDPTMVAPDPMHAPKLRPELPPRHARVVPKRFLDPPATSAPPVAHVVPQEPVQSSPPPVQTGGISTGSVNGFPCGGSLPPCYVLSRESGGNPTIIEGHHTDPFVYASGLWQFMPGTWNRYKGYPYAAAAPPDIQNEKAIEVWANGAGCSHWSAC